MMVYDSSTSQMSTGSALPALEIKFKIIPAPEELKEEVECFRLAEYSGEGGLAINVSLNGMPGIVFQHHKGRSPIKSIVTRSGRITFNGDAPTLFVYGQNTEPGLMNHHGPFTTMQVILKPYALKTLLGVDAAGLTHRLVGLREFSSEDLNSQLLEANNGQKRIALLTNFLIAQKNRFKTGDGIVKEGLSLIHKSIHSVSVKYLLEQLGLSERQFEKRFTQAVGISPQFYIRVKRFNEAIRLMKTGQFERLTDVAHALNYYDQSHFIRDIKEFSGITPKSIAQKADDFHDQGGYFQVER